MSIRDYFTGEQAIEFWTGVYMSVTGSPVRAPEPPLQLAGPEARADIEREDTREEIEPAA